MATKTLIAFFRLLAISLLLERHRNTCCRRPSAAVIKTSANLGDLRKIFRPIRQLSRRQVEQHSFGKIYRQGKISLKTRMRCPSFRFLSEWWQLPCDCYNWQDDDIRVDHHINTRTYCRHGPPIRISWRMFKCFQHHECGSKSKRSLR